MKKKVYDLGTPPCLTSDGVRASGFSWLCTCGTEFLARDVEVLAKAKQKHQENHAALIREMVSR